MRESVLPLARIILCEEEAGDMARQRMEEVWAAKRKVSEKFTLLSLGGFCVVFLCWAHVFAAVPFWVEVLDTPAFCEGFPLTPPFWPGFSVPLPSWIGCPGVLCVGIERELPGIMSVGIAAELSVRIALGIAAVKPWRTLS